MRLAARAPRGGQRLLAVTTALSAVLAAIPVASASARDAIFALKPVEATKSGYFVLRGKPGETVRGSVRVLNIGDVAGRANLYAVDATTGQTSGAVYRPRHEPKRTVGAWLKLARSTVMLDPGESEVVTFSVRIPKRAAAGGYLGGIVTQRATQTAKPKAASGKSGSFTIRIRELSVLAVQVDVPGRERAQMTLTGIKAGRQAGHQSVLLGIGNTGNAFVKGRGSVKIVDRGGRLAHRSSFNLDTFVPHTHIDFPVYIQGKALAPGRYRGTVSIAYRGRSLTRSFPFAITAAEVAQTYGSRPTSGVSGPSIAPTDNDTLVYILIAVSILSLSAALFFWRARRLA